MVGRVTVSDLQLNLDGSFGAGWELKQQEIAKRICWEKLGLLRCEASQPLRQVKALMLSTLITGPEPT
jgi:hypothetical protein